MKSNSLTRMLRIIGLLGALLFVLPSCRTNDQSPGVKRVSVSPRPSPNKIRDELLKYTAVGSTYVEVHEFVQYHLKYRDTPDYKNEPAGRPRGLVYESAGVRNIAVFLGEYGFPGRTSTFVTWAFDKNDKLIDVIVVKERDSL